MKKTQWKNFWSNLQEISKTLKKVFLEETRTKVCEKTPEEFLNRYPVESIWKYQEMLMNVSQEKYLEKSYVNS